MNGIQRCQYQDSFEEEVNHSYIRSRFNEKHKRDAAQRPQEQEVDLESTGHNLAEDHVAGHAPQR